MVFSLIHFRVNTIEFPCLSIQLSRAVYYTCNSNHPMGRDTKYHILLEVNYEAFVPNHSRAGDSYHQDH